MYQGLLEDALSSATRRLATNKGTLWRGLGYVWDPKHHFVVLFGIAGMILYHSVKGCAPFRGIDMPFVWALEKQSTICTMLCTICKHI